MVKVILLFGFRRYYFKGSLAIYILKDFYEFTWQYGVKPLLYLKDNIVFDIDSKI